MYIFHIAVRAEWENASADGYTPGNFNSEGFVHCSARHQLREVANERYAGRTDLLLIRVDPDRLKAPLVWEDCHETGMEFPHVYGPLDLDAITWAGPFLPDRHGRFDWWADG